MRPLAAVLLLASAVPGGAARAEELVDGIAAQVGSDIVLVSEVRNLVGADGGADARAPGAPDADVAPLRLDALERLIERALIRQVVRRAELEATDPEVDTPSRHRARERPLARAARRDGRGEGLPYASTASASAARSSSRR